MNKKLPFIFFSVVVPQSILWNSSIMMNEYNYFTWDYNEDKLFFYSNNKEYRCEMVSRECNEYHRNYIPTTYILTSNYYFINDIVSGGTCRYNYNGQGLCYPSSYKEYLKEFQSISVAENYLYIRYPELNRIRIFDINSWESKSLPLVTTLKNLNTTWYVKDDGLYAAKVSETIVEIFKYSLDGNYLWKSTFPYCQTQDPKNEILFAVKQSKVFVICTPINLMAIYYSREGNIISQYAIDKGNVVAMECSPSFLFILYGDGNVVQYTLDFNYVFTYSVDNMKTPKYNMLRVDERYMFYVLCKNNTECFIYQWSVYSDIKEVTVFYETNKLSGNASSITRSSEVAIRRKVVNVENKQFQINNSFFTPVAFKDKLQQQHIIYFSGGQIIGKGICGDIFLHDMIISEENGKLNLNVLPPFKLPEINYPLNDYAASLITSDGKYFYLIHGGISCDYQTIYSDLFAIDIKSKEYIRLQQNEEIA